MSKRGRDDASVISPRSSHTKLVVVVSDRGTISDATANTSGRSTIGSLQNRSSATDQTRQRTTTSSRIGLSESATSSAILVVTADDGNGNGFASTTRATSTTRMDIFDQEENNLALISDTEATVRLLMQRYGLQQCEICAVPVVLVHQVYTVLHDRSMVDRELCEARESFRLRMMRSTTGARDVVVTTEEAYRYAAHELADAQTTPALKHVFRAFANTVLAEVSDMFITRHDLVTLLLEKNDDSYGDISGDSIESGSISRCANAQVNMDDAVAQLNASGLLMRKLDSPGNVEAYWFNLPKMGALVNQVKVARSALVKTLKRTRYKQILRKKLEARTRVSKDCNLPIGFILADALGAGVVTAIDSHLGPGTLIGLGPLSK